MERVLANLSSKVRSIKREGREFLVAPVTFLRPQVLNGSKGPLLYTPEAIRQSEPDWDGVPMVVNHPMKDGHHISAADSGVLRNVGIGLVKHPYTDKDGVLRGYGWFDVEKTTKVDPRIVHRLRSGQPIELSTGLFTSNKKAPLGSAYKGTPYSHVAEGYQPDHLAILPDQVGACSLRDGCGVLANRSSRPTKEQLTTLLLNSDSATHSIHRQLQSLLINAIGQPHSKNTGHFKPLNAGTGRGEAHDHAQLGTVTLTDQDKELGADAAKQKAELNQNPPNWAVDETKWERAKAAADKGKYTGDMYWAVVARIYQNMGGIIASKTTNNQEAIVAKLNQKLREQVNNATKTEGDETLSASAFAYVPDPKKPSTWKLRIDDAQHVGAAIAALGKGFRGQKVDIPAEDLAAVKKKVRAAWLKHNPDKTEADLPKLLVGNATKTKKELQKAKAKDESAVDEEVVEDEVIAEIPETTQNAKPNQPEIVKVLANHFIYRDGDNLFRQGFTVNDSSEASLVGKPKPVTKRVKSEEAVGNDGGRADQEGLDEDGTPKEDEEGEDGWVGEDDVEAEVIEEQDNSDDSDSDVADDLSVTNSKGDSDMALKPEEKKQIVDNLIGNCGDCGWTEKDRETLNAMKDENLVTMEECRKKMAANAQKLAEAETKNQQLAANQARRLTDQEWMDQAPPPVKRLLANAQAIEAQEKTQLITRLVSNIDDDGVRKAQADRLAARSVEDLRADVALLPQASPIIPTANYLGMAPAFGQPVANDGVDKDDILPLPTINWAKQA